MAFSEIFSSVKFVTDEREPTENQWPYPEKLVPNPAESSSEQKRQCEAGQKKQHETGEYKKHPESIKAVNELRNDLQNKKLSRNILSALKLIETGIDGQDYSDSKLLHKFIVHFTLI